MTIVIDFLFDKKKKKPRNWDEYKETEEIKVTFPFLRRYNLAQETKCQRALRTLG